MNFKYICKNSEETSQLEKRIKLLEDSQCFDALSGPREFNVTYEGDLIVLTPLSPQTHLVLCNLYKNKNFKIDSVDIQPSSGKFNLEFYVEGAHYIIKSN